MSYPRLDFIPRLRDCLTLPKEKQVYKKSKWYNLYRTPAWYKIRKAVLAKHPLCFYCLNFAVPKQSVSRVADHRRRHNGNRKAFFDMGKDENGIDKIVGCCFQCHWRKSAAERGQNAG